MNAMPLILIALLTAAVPAHGAMSVRFERADEQPESIWPYRAAKLTIRNDSQKIIRAVRFRWRRGGPSFVHPVAIAPHTSALLAVELPAAALQQVYQVALLEADHPNGPALAELSAEIDWTLTDLATDAFMDGEAYDPWRDNIPVWSSKLRWSVLLGGVLYCLALAGCLFIRRRGLRATAVLILAAAASIGVWYALSAQEFIVQHQTAINDASPAGRSMLVVLTCRRTTEWTYPGVRLAPVYYSEDQMAGDTMTIHATHGVRVLLKPNQVRLFRRAGEALSRPSPPAGRSPTAALLERL